MELRQPKKPYHSDHSVVYSCQYHVIFCPKYWRKVLTEAVAARMKTLVLEKQAEYGYSMIKIEVMPDHFYLLLDVDPRIGINRVVGKLKGYGSHELRAEFPRLKKRLPALWTRSKVVSTVGAVTLEVVQASSEEQKGV